MDGERNESEQTGERETERRSIKSLHNQANLSPKTERHKATTAANVGQLGCHFAVAVAVAVAVVVVVVVSAAAAAVVAANEARL